MLQKALLRLASFHFVFMFVDEFISKVDEYCKFNSNPPPDFKIPFSEQIRACVGVATNKMYCTAGTESTDSINHRLQTVDTTAAMVEERAL